LLFPPVSRCGLHQSFAFGWCGIQFLEGSGCQPRQSFAGACLPLRKRYHAGAGKRVGFYDFRAFLECLGAR